MTKITNRNRSIRQSLHFRQKGDLFVKNCKKFKQLLHEFRVNFIEKKQFNILDSKIEMRFLLRMSNTISAKREKNTKYHIKIK